MFDRSVIRPIAAAIGAAALVFAVAPGTAFAKDAGSGHRHHHSHEHAPGPTASDSPLGPHLIAPTPPTGSGHTTPAPGRTPDALRQLQQELAAMDARAQAAVAQQRAALIAQLAELQRALQLLKGHTTRPSVTPTPPPPASTPPSHPTPAPQSSAPAEPQPAGVPSSGPSVLTVGPTIFPGVQPQAPPTESAPSATNNGRAPPPNQGTSPSAQESSHAALAQPIPGLSPASSVLLIAILSGFVAGILFLVLGAGYRGRRRA